MMLKVEAGKYYRASNGRKVGPMMETAAPGIFAVAMNIFRWGADGECSGGMAHVSILDLTKQSRAMARERDEANARASAAAAADDAFMAAMGISR